MTSVLYIAKYFPPVGGAGVQRSVKFVKYLPGFGILPVVLTEEADHGDRWSPEDSSMLAEIPAEIPVHRARWQRDPDRASDARRRAEAMIRLGVEEGRRHHVRAVFVTMSPFGDASIARRIAAELAVPWVADLRDPWAFDEFIPYRTAFHRERDKKRMELSLAGAATIVMNTPESARLVEEGIPGLRGSRITHLTNGYDAADFAGDPPDAAEGGDRRFTIVHSGYLHTAAGFEQQRKQWLNRLLGRTIKGVRRLCRSHYYLLQALEAWVARDPSVADQVELVFVGSTTETDQQLAAASAVSSMVSFTGYLPHRESVDRVRSADLLFFPMHGLAAGCRSSIVPGKAYEYMASGRSILAAVPQGDARQFLERAGSARICDPDDVAAMSAQIEEEFRQWREGGGKHRDWQPDAVAGFERRALTRRLAGILFEAAGIDAPHSAGEPESTIQKVS